MSNFLDEEQNKDIALRTAFVDDEYAFLKRKHFTYKEVAQNDSDLLFISKIDLKGSSQDQQKNIRVRQDLIQRVNARTESSFNALVNFALEFLLDYAEEQQKTIVASNAPEEN